MRRALLPVYGLFILIPITACNRTTPPATPAGPPPAAVTVETVVPGIVPITFEYVGRLEASREVEIRSRVSGVIQKRYFEEGAPVKAGSLLFKIDDAAYAAQLRAAKAEVDTQAAKLAQARLDQSRNKKLAAQGFISNSALDNSETTIRVADASMRSSSANLSDARINLGYTTITAPISGIMGRALQVEGALVMPGGAALTTLAQINPIYARFSIGEDARLALQKQIHDGELQTTGKKSSVGLLLADGSRAPVQGRLNFSDYKANPQTGAFDMRAEFPNANDELKPGQFVRVVVEGGQMPDALTVPQPAVQDGPTGKFVYVVGQGPDKQPIALPRPVEVGAWVGDKNSGGNRWVIKRGLQAGDKVVVDGMARIFFPGMPITPSAASSAPGSTAKAPVAAAPAAQP
ncbi:MAG: efflux RND transporter periplasmic adaptor subunit [Thiobacillus sp.]